MSANHFGKIFTLHSFGESHGPAIGGSVDGCPAGLEIDLDSIQSALDRRRPGQSELSTQRKEEDKVQILSGIFEGKTTGTPIGFIIPNKDQQSKDYSELKDSFRPSHSDFTYQVKYGHRDYRGGGRSSARETAIRVVGGAIAGQLLEKLGVSVKAFVQQVAHITAPQDYHQLDLEKIESTITRCPDPETAKQIEEAILQAKQEGDSLGGIVRCVASGVPAGWGEPVYDKLDADLAKAMLSINASKGFSIGSGFLSAAMKGSEHNDAFVKDREQIRTVSNHSGGVQGGISNGMDIYFDVAFKPVATILKSQQYMKESGETLSPSKKGRHDPCVLPRAVPIVEAMCNLVLADHYLRNLSSKI